MITPTVSVIVPNYNHAQFLAKRLESVFNQTYSDFEVILLDDCSTDLSKSILKKYAKHEKVSKLILNSKNSGSPFKQWKKGIKDAKGKFVWIAESDDWAEADFLETMVPLLERGNGLVYCRSDEVDEHDRKTSDFFWADGLDGKRWKTDFNGNGLEEINKYLLYRCTIPNASACLFRKDIAPLNSGFDRMRYCGDWLFWIKLLEGSSLAYSHKVLNHFRHHAASTRNKKNQREELRKRLEMIYIIEYSRKKFRMGAPVIEEYEKYDWVEKGFYRKLLVPSNVKDKLIFYSNRHFPGYYDSYREIKERLLG
jgi:glycosyltransferase involved in cell wall biosynthesis